MNRPVERATAVAIASDSPSEAALVKSLLADEFDNIRVHIAHDRTPRKEEHPSPDVLVLAFKQLAAAEHFYLGLYRRAQTGQLRQHRTVVLCAKEELRDAYQHCRNGLFDDYVLFWPVVVDPTRLLMAVHAGVRQLNAKSGPAPISAGHVGGSPENIQAERRLTAFIVDDDSSQRKLIARFLEAEGFELEYAANGHDALGLLSNLRPDVMLLDLKMPGMDGLEVLRRLRSAPQQNTFPVIMVTGTADRDIVRSTLEFGVVDFLVKPFDRHTLLLKVRHALGLADEGVREQAAK